MPEIHPTISASGCMVGRDSAGHTMITARAGSHAPTPTMKVKSEH